MYGAGPMGESGLLFSAGQSKLRLECWVMRATHSPIAAVLLLVQVRLTQTIQTPRRSRPQLGRPCCTPCQVGAQASQCCPLLCSSGARGMPLTACIFKPCLPSRLICLPACLPACRGGALLWPPVLPSR